MRLFILFFAAPQVERLPAAGNPLPATRTPPSKGYPLVVLGTGGGRGRYEKARDAALALAQLEKDYQEGIVTEGKKLTLGAPRKKTRSLQPAADVPRCAHSQPA